MHFERAADTDTVSTYQVFLGQFGDWSPTALKRPDKSKQCHCLQFTQRLPLILQDLAQVMSAKLLLVIDKSVSLVTREKRKGQTV